MTRTRAVAGLLALLISTPAAAQVGRFEVQRFHPATSQELGYISAESGETRLPNGFEAGLFPHFSFDPLTAEDDDGNEFAVISHQLVTHVWLSWSPTEFLRLAADMPLYIIQAGDEAALRSEGLDGSGLGDLRLIPKLAVLNRPTGDGPALSLIAPLSLPVGNTATFQGEGFRVEPGVAFDFTQGRMGIAANMGYLIREKTDLGDLAVGDQITYKVAGRYPLAPDLSGLLEFNGALGVADGDVSSEGSPLEVLGALRYRIGSGSITAGAGTGIVSGVGTPSVRTFVGYAYQPVASSAPMMPLAVAPAAAEPVEPSAPSPTPAATPMAPSMSPAPIVAAAPAAPAVADRDADRILDGDDKCPDDPEDMDRYQDEDGCPDLDNDGDGVLDLQDHCPMMAEDKDGHADSDGCPDNDNDGDGIPDASDKCPDNPEDFDRFQDEDGCPELDNDGDGVADLDDTCPNLLGKAGTQGCPVNQMGETFPPSMDIVVFFASGSSRLDRYAVTHLRRLVRRLESDSSLQRIEIHGHADGSATSHVNNAISRRRAEHARDYLIRRGIAPGRLVIVVHGEDRPVEKNTSREGRSANRRVEFVIPGGN